MGKPAPPHPPSYSMGEYLAKRDTNPLHDGNWFMERAERDARRSTRKAALVAIVIAVAIGLIFNA